MFENYVTFLVKIKTKSVVNQRNTHSQMSFVYFKSRIFLSLTFIYLERIFFNNYIFGEQAYFGERWLFRMSSFEILHGKLSYNTPSRAPQLELEYWSAALVTFPNHARAEQVSKFTRYIIYRALWRTLWIHYSINTIPRGCPISTDDWFTLFVNPKTCEKKTKLCKISARTLLVLISGVSEQKQRSQKMK